MKPDFLCASFRDLIFLNSRTNEHCGVVNRDYELLDSFCLHSSFSDAALCEAVNAATTQHAHEHTEAIEQTPEAESTYSTLNIYASS